MRTRSLSFQPANRLFGVSLCIVAVLGLTACGKDEGSAAQRLGSTVGETLTSLSTGIGQGIDKQMAVNVVLSDELVEQGFSKTTAKSQGLGEKSISVYLLSAKALKGQLVAKAFDKNGSEVLIDKYVLSLRKAT